ncbi:MAG: hypothetical protein AAB316_02310 [Bacteroidota bacterium]
MRPVKTLPLIPLLALLLSPVAHADPLAPTSYDLCDLPYLLPFILPCIYVEYLFIRDYLGLYEIRWKLLRFVALYPVFTYPATLFWAGFIGPFSEILPIVVEAAALEAFLARHKSALARRSEKQAPRSALFASLVANLATYTLERVAFQLADYAGQSYFLRFFFRYFIEQHHVPQRGPSAGRLHGNHPTLGCPQKHPATRREKTFEK